MHKLLNTLDYFDQSDELEEVDIIKLIKDYQETFNNNKITDIRIDIMMEHFDQAFAIIFGTKYDIDNNCPKSITIRKIDRHEYRCIYDPEVMQLDRSKLNTLNKFLINVNCHELFLEYPQIDHKDMWMFKKIFIDNDQIKKIKINAVMCDQLPYGEIFGNIELLSLHVSLDINKLNDSGLEVLLLSPKIAAISLQMYESYGIKKELRKETYNIYRNVFGKTKSLKELICNTDYPITKCFFDSCNKSIESIHLTCYNDEVDKSIKTFISNSTTLTSLTIHGKYTNFIDSITYNQYIKKLLFIDPCPQNLIGISKIISENKSIVELGIDNIGYVNTDAENLSEIFQLLGKNTNIMHLKLFNPPSDYIVPILMESLKENRTIKYISDGLAKNSSRPDSWGKIIKKFANNKIE